MSASPPRPFPDSPIYRFTLAFGDAVVFMIKRMSIAFIVPAALIYSLVHLFRTTPTSFVPNEDQGYLMALVMMPDAASLKRTAATAAELDAIFARHPAVDHRSAINGFSLIDGQHKSNVSTFFVTLKDFEECSTGFGDSKMTSISRSGCWF